MSLFFFQIMKEGVFGLYIGIGIGFIPIWQELVKSTNLVRNDRNTNLVSLIPDSNF